MKQNETSQPGGPSRIRTAIVSLTALIQILLAFQKWRRKHYKNLELIVSETPRLDENHYPLLIGTGRDKPQIVAATRRPKRRSIDSKKSSTKPKPNGLKSQRERRLGPTYRKPLGRQLQGPRNQNVVGR